MAKGGKRSKADAAAAAATEPADVVVKAAKPLVELSDTDIDTDSGIEVEADEAVPALKRVKAPVFVKAPAALGAILPGAALKEMDTATTEIFANDCFKKYKLTAPTSAAGSDRWVTLGRAKNLKVAVGPDQPWTRKDLSYLGAFPKLVRSTAIGCGKDGERTLFTILLHSTWHEESRRLAHALDAVDRRSTAERRLELWPVDTPALEDFQKMYSKEDPDAKVLFSPAVTASNSDVSYFTFTSWTKGKYPATVYVAQRSDTDDEIVTFRKGDFSEVTDGRLLPIVNFTGVGVDTEQRKIRELAHANHLYYVPEDLLAELQAA